jgi:hypothetical protein
MWWRMALCAGLALGAGSARASSMQQGVQDFADGQILGCFSSGCPAPWTGPSDPFNRFLGSDPGIAGATNFSAEWSFALGSARPTSARVEFGLYDHDSSAASSQVASFMLNPGGPGSHDLTALLDAVLERPGIGEQMEYNVIGIELPQAVLDAVVASSMRFVLELQGPAWIKTKTGSNVSATGSNGAGLDFVRLSFTSPATAPEPAPLGLAALALAALALRRSARA